MAVTDREMYDLYRDKIKNILQTGQEYTVQGSRAVKNPALVEVEAMAMKYERRLLRANGFTGRNVADFSATGRGLSSQPRE